MKISRLFLFKEVIAIYCKNHVKPLNCGQNWNLVNVKKHVTYSLSITVFKW
jgi:hypothetical protein